ncbi:MAG: hypothetical protein P8Z79_15845 [Sedimentisphaerales bacterium]|jgi:hypothetical protein
MVPASLMLIAAIRLTSLLAIRVRRRSGEMVADAAEAHLHAESAVELDLHITGR